MSRRCGRMCSKWPVVKIYSAFHKIISILKLKMIKYNLLFGAFIHQAS